MIADRPTIEVSPAGRAHWWICQWSRSGDAGQLIATARTARAANRIARAAAASPDYPAHELCLWRRA